MSADTDVGSDEGSPEEENASMTDVQTPMQPSDESAMTQAPASGEESGGEAPPQPAEGRRTQLKIVREGIESLANDVGSFRKSHESGVKKLNAQVASIRKDLGAHLRSKDLGEHVRSHEADTKKLEKQIAALRNDLAAVKAQIVKEAAKSRAKEEAALSRVLAKVRPPAKASKKAPAKKAPAKPKQAKKKR
jgi:hypothetical protein